MGQSEVVGPARDRIGLLDALRGFALIGILLVNIEDWAGWSSISPEQQLALASADSNWWYDFLRRALLEGKFYSIFSFLFGLGFALQLARLRARGADGLAIYRRRLLVLLAIGIIHMTFVWEGDILTLYALLGLLLPLLHDWGDRALVRGALLLLLLPIPGFILAHAAGIPPKLGLDVIGDWLFDALGGELGQERMWRAREGWNSLLIFNVSGPPFRFAGFFESWRIPKVLAMMMLGVFAGRRLVAGTLLDDKRLLRRVAIAGFAVGLPGSIAYALVGGLGQEEFGRGLAATSLYAIGIAPLGLAYAASFALLWSRVPRLLGILAWPGRMALTNYLLHSLLGVTIFYGVGFGLFGTLPPMQFIAVALLIFVVLTAASRLWLDHFVQGPMEALWRRLTYGRRRTADAPALAG